MIFFLVLVLGCSGEKKTEVVSTDLLMIGDITVIPSEIVKPEDTIIIRMDVENVGQTDVWMLVDKDSTTKGGTVPSAFNAKPTTDGDMVLVNNCDPLYKLTEFKVVSASGDVCTTPPSGYDVGSLFGEKPGDILKMPCYLKFRQGETHVFQWKVTAPSKGAIAGMTNDCKFNFQAIYGSMAKTFTYVYFAKPPELAQRIYTNKEMTLAGDNIASYGPVVANFETDAQPIRAGANDEWTVFMNLKNLGSGIAKIYNLDLYSVDDTFRLINIPLRCDLMDYGSKLGIVRTDIEKYLSDMKCDTLLSTSIDECNRLTMLKNKLEIFVTESSRVSCTVNVPEGISIMQPYKFKALAQYAYSQGKDVKITTDPTP